MGSGGLSQQNKDELVFVLISGIVTILLLSTPQSVPIWERAIGWPAGILFSVGLYFGYRGIKARWLRGGRSKTKTSQK